MARPMNGKPPFDPPYFTIVRADDVQVTEVMEDGTYRLVPEEDSRRLQSIYNPSVDLEAAYPMQMPEKSAAVVSRPVPTVPEHTGSKILLNVPSAQKEDAKLAGAKWDAGIKKWYVPGTHRSQRGIIQALVGIACQRADGSISFQAFSACDSHLARSMVFGTDALPGESLRGFKRHRQLEVSTVCLVAHLRPKSLWKDRSVAVRNEEGNAKARQTYP